MSHMLDDLTLRFKSFGDTLDKSLTSIDLSFSKLQLPTLKGDVKQPTALNETSGVLEASKLEKEAARARAELILQQLPQGYFDHAFDPLEYELRQMGEISDQTDIDNVVDKLTAAVEVVGMRLAKHVLKEQEKLIAGITNVTQVEDDLKAAHVICQSSRAQLKMAAEEVQLQLKVITSTRRKQAYMEVLETVSKAKRVKDLPQALRKVHEAGDHGQAIVLCVDCFQAVEALASFQMAPELQTTVQQLYYDTLQRLDAALHNVCSSFTTEGYTKLLEAFVLQGLPGPALAAKVLACFQATTTDAAVRLVRSMVLAKAAFSSGDSCGSLSTTGRMDLEQRKYEDLCKLLPSEMVSSCICKFLEVVFELLCSYEAMAQWHAAGLLQQDTAIAAAITAVQQHPEAFSGSHLQQVQAATTALLKAVATALAEGRGAILNVAATQLQVLLTAGAAKCKGDEFTKVLENCLQFISMAEAFAGSALPKRASLLAVLDACVNAYHISNMESLKLALAVENWEPNGSISSSAASTNPHCLDIMCMRHYLQCSPYVLPSFADVPAVRDFGTWQQAGNPFRGRARIVGGTRSLPASYGEAMPEQPEQHPGAPPSRAAPAAASSCRVATKSGMLVLRMLSSYAALMPLFPESRVVLWAAMSELFDNFLLACFILFSGVSLEALVWQEDQLPHRLRTALLRITTSPGCKYKAQVEEIQNKPDTSLLSSFGNSLLDFGISNGSIASNSMPAPTTDLNNSSGSIAASNSSSKLDLFSKFKDTMVELINTDLSQPVPSASYHPSQQIQQPQVQRADQRKHAGNVHSTSYGSGPSPAAAAAADATQTTQTQQCQGHVGYQWALKERVVAIESLTTLADALRAAKPALLEHLRKTEKAVGIIKEVDGYFSRTVDAAQDLAVAIYRGGAKQLLGGVVDAAHGTAAQIAACNYSVKEPASSYQPWTSVLLQHFQAFSNFLKESNLPPDVQDKMWEAAVNLGSTAMLEGLGRVRHCTMQGRAGMSLDLSAVEKGLRTMAPAAAVSSLRLVDNYIKAFYIPWSELGRWAQVHVAEYGKGKILALVEVMAEAYGVKRSDRSTMLDRLNRELAEFS